ncbi:MAG: sigma-70 family RNA polymerase sigma factor [Clostridiales bacterium]|nr:sigma-70 family RNA polymerase sigma factor [Clostridiales bacterium]MBQ3322008.1 sigma-70 family RNA polymerase sigma factor [Bacillota bacterium]
MLKKELINSIENPEIQLAAEAQAGDALAEETLIRNYSGIVYKKARAYFMAGADAEDVVQEGMIGLLKAVRSYDADKNASFGTFAERCVTNQIISAIRSADRIKHKPLNTSVSLNKPVSADAASGAADQTEITLGDTLSTNPADSPDEMLVIKDVAYYILNNGDNVFSDLEMKVLSEYIKGFTSSQIAERLGKTSKSVDNALQRTRKKVNAYLWK